MSKDNPRPGGIFQSFRRFCDSALALAQNRLELFGLEVEEQKARLLRVLLLGAAAIFLANTAVLVITATIIVLVGENARVPVLVSLCVFYALLATVAFVLLRKELRSAPPAFHETLSEFKKDRQWLNLPK
jgi:uncharacterized membrane protein YqjE